MVNFNFSHKNEYQLNINLIDEFIRLYGIECKLLITEKKNTDPIVFGDWSNIKTNNKDIFDVHIYSENADSFERQEYQFTEFGFNTLDNMSGFISIKEAKRFNLDMEKLLSSLIILPSNKILEITDCEYQVPGINNLWAYSDVKSAFKLTLRTYEIKLHDNFEPYSNVNTVEVDNLDDIDGVVENYDSIDGFFDTILKQESDLEYEAEVNDTNTVKDEKLEPQKTQKPTVILDEKDPFGW